MRRGVAAALAGLLLAWPVSAVELTKIATIPKGQIQFDEGIPTGDADHDGRQELYFEQSQDPFSLNIWEHWGSNSYQPVKTLTDGCHPVALGDTDEDGLSDLLCVWARQIGLAFLLESLTPTSFPSQKVWEEPLGGFVGMRGYFQDADQDGKHEMWIVPNDPDQIEVWENRGDNTYVLVALLTDPLMNPSTLVFEDFDGDGATEIAVGGALNFVFVWENTADDTYALVWTFEFSDLTNVQVVAAAKDLDGDGKPEFLVGGNTLDVFGHGVTIFESIGDNNYAPVWEVRGEGHLIRTYISVGDVDGDGVEEFAVAIPGTIQIYKAFGDNDFRIIAEVPYPDDQAIKLADLNGNGVDELIFNGAVDALGVPTQIHISELADIQPSVLIPAWFPLAYPVQSGSPLTVQAELFNRTDVLEVMDVWLELYQGKGEGGPTGPLLRQELLASQAPLSPKQSVTRQLTLPLPGLPGLYTLQLKVGTFPDQVVDTRWFTAVVSLP